MKKTLLFVSFILLTSVALKAQTNWYPPSGNVGIGTTSPGSKLDVVGNINTSGYFISANATSNTPFASQNFYGTAGYWGFRTSTNFSYNLDLFNSASPINAMTVLQTGSVGIATDAPVSLFQVDDGCTKASIGDASGSSVLNWGTSYLGFNASRSGTGSTSSWLTNGDGGNNGGGVMYSSVFGDMYFAIIPRTGGSDQTLTDANIASNIAMRIDHLDGAVYAKKVYVQLTGWPDYVFKKDYKLMPLAQVKSYIDKNQHLPGLPTDKEVEAKGLDVGEMNKLLTKKVEELTLYVIDLKAEKDKQDALIKKMELRLNALEKQ